MHTTHDIARPHVACALVGLSPPVETHPRRTREGSDVTAGARGSFGVAGGAQGMHSIQPKDTASTFTCVHGWHTPLSSWEAPAAACTERGPTPYPRNTPQIPLVQDTSPREACSTLMGCVGAHGEEVPHASGRHEQFSVFLCPNRGKDDRPAAAKCHSTFTGPCRWVIRSA